MVTRQDTIIKLLLDIRNITSGQDFKINNDINISESITSLQSSLSSDGGSYKENKKKSNKSFTQNPSTESPREMSQEDSLHSEILKLLSEKWVPKAGKSREFFEPYVSARLALTNKDAVYIAKHLAKSAKNNLGVEVAGYRNLKIAHLIIERKDQIYR